MRIAEFGLQSGAKRWDRMRAMPQQLWAVSRNTGVDESLCSGDWCQDMGFRWDEIESS